MLRNYPQPPTDGLCVYAPNQSIFTAPVSKGDIREAKQICQQCPKLKQCQQYTKDLLAEDNRDRPPGVPARVPIAGVVGGEVYEPTDTEGRKIDIGGLLAKVT